MSNNAIVLNGHRSEPCACVVVPSSMSKCYNYDNCRAMAVIAGYCRDCDAILATDCGPFEEDILPTASSDDEDIPHADGTCQNGGCGEEPYRGHLYCSPCESDCTGASA